VDVFLTLTLQATANENNAVLSPSSIFSHLYEMYNYNYSLTAARNRLWVVAPSMLTGHQQEPMRQQQ